MILITLTLQNFRSYAKKTFAFSPPNHAYCGTKYSGQDQYFEAIMFCVTGKSFRADQDREAIRWGSELSAISLPGLGTAAVSLETRDKSFGGSGQELSANHDNTKLELFITQGEVQGAKAPLKKYLVNGVPRGQVDFVGNLRAVLFGRTLELVTDSPRSGVVIWTVCWCKLIGSTEETS